MQGCFTMIMLIDLSNATLSFAELVKEAEELGNQIGVQIILQHKDIFKAMHRI